MVNTVRGDVVVVPFPFSDLSGQKRRPALVVAELDGDDRILCMITSQSLRDRFAVPLDQADFVSGGLAVPSNVRPSRLFTGDASIVHYVAGKVSLEKMRQVTSALLEVLAEP